MRKAVLRVVGVALAVWAGAVAGAAALEIAAASPRGQLSGGEQRRIQIVFSSAMVPLGETATTSEPPPWVSVSPAIQARWRWAGTAELVAEPVTPLPAATAYTVTLAEGTRAVDGSSLDAPFSFTFQTPRPIATFEREAPELDEDYGWSLGSAARLDFSVAVAFDQPVDAGSLLEHLQVRLEPRPLPDAAAVLGAAQVEELAREGGDALAGWRTFLEAARPVATETADFTLESDPTAPTTRFLVRPVGCWPPSHEVVVTLAAGVTSLEGALASADPRVERYPTAWPVAPLGFAGPRASGGGFDPDEVELSFSTPVTWRGLVGRLRVRGAGQTSWRGPAVDSDRWYWDYPTTSLDLEPLGLAGGGSFEVCIDAGTADEFAQTLPFPWCATLKTGHHAPLFYLVEGDGVVEWEGPHVVPLRLRNVTGLREGSRRLAEEELVPALVDRDAAAAAADGDARERRVSVPADRTVLWPVGLDSALAGTPGVVLARLAVSDVVAGSEYDEDRSEDLRAPRSAIVQVTSLGLTVKASGYEGILVWVTRLASATPVEGAEIVVRDRDNRVLWRGRSDAGGLARTPAAVSLAQAYAVTARLGDDLAYARVEWWEGHRGWEFNLPVDWDSAAPVVGSVWSDRGVVRPGEKLRIKAVLRRRTDAGLRLPDGRVWIVVRDARGEDLEAIETEVDGFGGCEAEIAIPASAALGSWNVAVGPGYDREAQRFAAEPGWSVWGSFRVAEFRRPKFRVAVAVAEGVLVAGDTLVATVEGDLLAGGGMAGAPVQWAVRAERSEWQPSDTRWSGWSFLPWHDVDESEASGSRTLASASGELDDGGNATVEVAAVEAEGAWPSVLTVEAEVSDIDRQTQAARTTVRLLPGEFMLGLRSPDMFVQAGDGVSSEVVALRPEGTPVAEVATTVELIRRHWESVRRREASGRYVFESRPVTTVVAAQQLTTGAAPVGFRFDLAEGGEYLLVARARDGRDNQLVAATGVYVFGSGFTPWRLDRGNRIDLVPERDRWSPGDTARVLIKSPWEAATALVTVERAGVVDARVMELTGTMPVIDVPIREDYAPNVFVSVVLVHGRVAAPADGEMVDPGRPAYRVGYCELTVPPRGRRLRVSVVPDRSEVRPGQKAVARVTVRSEDGTPRQAGVTVWAVDAGVLALTDYRTPDLMGSFYARRGLGVTTAESRSRLVGRRDYGTKADAAGGGGGRADAFEGLRRDFRALAFWRGDVVTGDDGSATVEFQVPDSLTTYRLMAVAVAGEQEFGSGEVELLVTKPLGLEPSPPRFLRPGDRARTVVVVRNRTGRPEEVDVTLELGAASPARLRGGASRTARVPAGGSAEVGFGLEAVAPGTVTLRLTAVGSGRTPERDAVEATIPVIEAVAAETDATFFTARGRTEEAVRVPEDAFADVGGLTLRVGATPLVEAEPALEWLLDYRHACAEQVASQLLGLTAIGELPWRPVEAVAATPTAEWQAGAVARLLACQRPDGGFAFWPDAGASSEALSAHVAWALAGAAAAGVEVDDHARERARSYLAGVLRRSTWAVGEEPAWTVKVLASFALQRLGGAEPAFFQGLFDTRDRAPVWGRALLAAAMLGADAGDPRAAVLLQEVRNHLAVEARVARLEEGEPGWGWWVWWSEPRGSASALLALAAADPGDPVVARLERGLLDHLARDRSRTTHDVAWMLQALAAAWRGEGGDEARPEVSAEVAGKALLRRVGVDWRSGWHQTEVPMAELQRLAARVNGRPLPLVVEVAGAGQVHVAASLAASPKRADRGAVSRGIGVSRALLDDADRSVEAVAAGDEVLLEITLDCPATRRFVAVEVPLPAGLEAVDEQLATSVRRPARESDEETAIGGGWYWRPGFDHVELRDDRIVLYATELPAGSTRHVVRCRATTAGTFAFAAARAEEMYAPEVYGTSSSATFEVRPR